MDLYLERLNSSTFNLSKIVLFNIKLNNFSTFSFLAESFKANNI